MTLSVKEQSAAIKAEHDLRYIFPASSKRKRFATHVMDCCVFHDDNTPSMLIAADHFCCFGCGAKGDLFDFTKRTRDWNWVKTVANHSELPLHTYTAGAYVSEQEAKDLKVFPPGMALVPHFNCDQRVLAYYREKGLTRPTILRFKLGFGVNPQRATADGEPSFAQHAFTIPLFDGGQLAGMKFRRNDCCPECWSPRTTLEKIDVFDDSITVASCKGCGNNWTVFGEKYDSLFGQKRFLWGIKDIPDTYNDTVFIVEGEFDRMIMWQYGYHCVTATGGALSFNKAMAAKLKRFRRVIALVDQDMAGSKGLKLMQDNLPDLITFPEWREGKDVSDVVKLVGDLTRWIKKCSRG